MAFTHTSPKKDEGVVATAATPLLFSVLRRVSAWSGLIPFFLFLILFLLIPAISVFAQALHDADGSFGFSAMREAISGQNLDAFIFSLKFSAGAAFVGVVFGGFLAYAAATAKRPRWLRNIVSSFSGVAANMGGLPLAFAFLSLL
ncbi:MAG: hypothetical protein RIS69_899, partial [Actinomycetota bacterium]